MSYYDEDGTLRDDDLTLEEAKKIADNYLQEQSPGSYVNEHPAALIERVAKYMIEHNEDAARAYLFC